MAILTPNQIKMLVPNSLFPHQHFTYSMCEIQHLICVDGGVQHCIALDVRFQVQNVYIWPQNKWYKSPQKIIAFDNFTNLHVQHHVVKTTHTFFFFLKKLHHTKHVAVKFVLHSILSGHCDLSCSTKHHMTPTLVTKVKWLRKNWCGMIMNSVGHTKSKCWVFFSYYGKLYTSYWGMW